MRFLCAIVLVFCLSSLGFAPRASAQDSASAEGAALRARIHEWSRYATAHNGSSLYVCTDKSIYVPNSYLLFTGYLFKGDHDTNQYHTIYVELADPARQRTVASDRFVVKDFVGSGSLFLPDTLAPGPYLLIAYTDALVHGQQQAPFRRLVYIRSPQERAFRLKVGAARVSQDSLRVTCRVTTSYGGLASGGSFSYRLASPTGVLQRGVRKIDAFGEVTLALPLADSALNEVMLSAAIKRDTALSIFWLPVRMTRQAWSIRFFPEGGNLVSGHNSRVGITLQDASGRGVAAEGALLEDGNPVSYFKTRDDGMGMLNCIPFSDKKYTIQLTNASSALSGIPGNAPVAVSSSRGNAPVVVSSSSGNAPVALSGEFPQVEPEGFTLAIPKGVVRDSMAVRIKAPGPDSRCTLMIYTNRDVLYASSIHLLAGEGVVYVPADSSLSGLATVGLFDSTGRSVAERTIYFPSQPLTVSVQSDSTEYHTGSKITLHIKVTDRQGRGVTSVFTLSSVLASRTNPDKDPDIMNYESLQGGPDSLPDGEVLPDSLMELALLTRFGDHHRWTDIISDTTPPGPFDRPSDFGYVLYRDKRVKAPVQLVLMGGGMTSYQPVETDSLGRFRLPEGMLIAPLRSHTILTVMDANNQDRYTLRLLNGYDTVNHALARDWYYLPPDPTDDLPDSPPVDDKEFNSVKTLKTIVIRAGNDHYFGDATCNDYVCPYNVLNCPNHPYGRRPVIGETYMYFDYWGAPPRQIVYQSCVSPKTVSSFLNEVQTIHTLQDFYHPDNRGSNAPGLETLVNSTLFWSPLTVTDKNGEATLTFYTQELPGRFYNIVQGVSEEGAISGKGVFKIVQ